MVSNVENSACNSIEIGIVYVTLIVTVYFVLESLMAMKRSSRSTRFPVATHIMCLLAYVKMHEVDTEYLSSTSISRSVAKNVVIIRQMVAMLVKAGLVRSAPGSKGGTRLAQDPDKITLLQVYRAVEKQDIFGVHDPSQFCPVANFVQDKLGKVFREAEDSFEKQLAEMCLSDLIHELDESRFAMV